MKGLTVKVRYLSTTKHNFSRIPTYLISAPQQTNLCSDSTTKKLETCVSADLVSDGFEQRFFSWLPL